MFGENLKTVAVRCVTCGAWIAVCLDEEDLARHREGVLAQDAFVDRDGAPYLSAGERELLISGLCNTCWQGLCPSDPRAYS